VAGERRGGLEITSSKTSPGSTAARPPGEVVFDLVFSNESLWTTVDPHAAQTIVEKSVEQKGVVDLGDLLREFVDRKTKPDLARGTVLAFAMELARGGVAVRIPAELQSLDRTARQKLVDVFRSGQKGADDNTQTLAQPSRDRAPASGARPAPARTSSGSNPPSAAKPSPRTSSPPAPARPEEAIDGWGKGLGEVTGARPSPGQSGPNRAGGRPAEGARASRTGSDEVSAQRRAPRPATEVPKERSRTNIERPKAAEGLAFGALLGPGRIGALSVAALLLIVGLVVGPRRSVVVDEDPLPGDIPCSRVEKNGPHAFCIVNLELISPRLTLDELATKKAAMLEAVRARGLVSVTFYNPDLTRFDPAPAPVRFEAPVAARVAREDGSPEPSSGGFTDFATSGGRDEDEGGTAPPADQVEVEPLITGLNEDGSPKERRKREHDDEHDGHGHDEPSSVSSSSSRGRAQVIQAPSGSSSSAGAKKKKKR